MTDKSSLIPPSLDGSIVWNNDMFSPSLQAAINDIVPSNDPIDKHDFNPVTFINENFTNEQSLIHIDTHMNKLRMKILKIDEEIINEVRLQSSTGTKGKQDLENAKRSINELLQKIGDIKSKAIKSEQMVTEICKDIKSLDCAKKNLTTAITTLKRLHMMVTGTEQLKEMVELSQYGRVANLLEATGQFAEGFRDYRDSPKIASLYSELEKIRSNVKDQIYEDFKMYQPRVSNQARPGEDNKYKQACYVIDALGSEMKKDFLRWFCDIQLSAYKSAYAPHGELYNLESTKKRYDWLKRQLKHFREEYADVFPVEWRMEEQIAYEFCVTTRLALSEILLINKNNINIEELLKQLNATIDFETDMYNKFSRSYNKESPNFPSQNDYQQQQQEDMMQEDEDQDDEDDDEEEQLDGQDDDSTQDGGSGERSPKPVNDVVEAISERWRAQEKKNKQKEWEKMNGGGGEKSPTMQQQQQQKEKEKQQVKPSAPKTYERFKGIISTCFDPYMDLYIGEENKKMGEALDKLISEERWIVDEDASNKVLGSGTDLINYFKQAVNRCSRLSTGETFYNLFLLFKKYLSQYATILSNKVNGDVGRQHGVEEDNSICFIINTAEHMSKTTIAITNKIKKLIDERYSEKIDLKTEQNEYSSVITKGIKSIVSGIEAKIEPVLHTMANTDWGPTFAYVGDHSPYVDQILVFINDGTNIPAKLLTTAHFKYFCDVFAASFIFSITQTIYKCERISEVGAQGMQLDITTIKTCFLGLPAKQRDAASNRYSKLVNTQFGKAEAILKVVGSPKESLVDTYNALIPEGSDKDFQKIMDLKGIKVGDKTELLEKYISKVDKTFLSFKKFLPPVSSIFSNNTTSTTTTTNNTNPNQPK